MACLQREDGRTQEKCVVVANTPCSALPLTIRACRWKELRMIANRFALRTACFALLLAPLTVAGCGGKKK